MTLEDEIQNLKDRVITLEGHVKALQFRAKHVEDGKAPKKYRGKNYSTVYIHDIFGKKVAVTIRKKKK